MANVFKFAKKRPTGRKTLEVHRHTFVSGPRSHGMFIQTTQETTSTFHHSHVDGHRGHRHPDTGPACFDIDKDEWFRTTGLKGGGRKTFTAKPSGEQFALVALTEQESTFKLIVGTPTPSVGQPGYLGEGPGIALPARMMLAFDLACVVKDGTKGGAA